MRVVGTGGGLIMKSNGHVICVGLDGGQTSKGGMKLPNERVHDQGKKKQGKGDSPVSLLNGQ